MGGLCVSDCVSDVFVLGKWWWLRWNADDRIAPNGLATVGGDPAFFVFKNLHVIGTMVGSMRDTDAALGFAARVYSILSPLGHC